MRMLARALASHHVFLGLGLGIRGLGLHSFEIAKAALSTTVRRNQELLGFRVSGVWRTLFV